MCVFPVLTSCLRPQNGVVWQLFLGQDFCPRLAQGEGKMYTAFKQHIHINVHFQVSVV